MSWVVFAFSGPVLWAISVHLDKYLVERFFKESNVAVMLLFTAFVGVLLLPFIWLYEPSVTAPGLGSIALIILAGILYMVAMLLYLQALQTEEASVVAPYFQAGPLFGYGLAYLVLGETLTGRQLAGGVLIILGALSVSVRFAYGARMFKTRLAVLMLTCGFAGALAGLIFKIFALDVEFWTTTFWMYAGEATLRLRLAPGSNLPPATFGHVAGQYRCPVVDQRLQRADQSRRRPGQSLRADVRAAEHRPGHRFDDDAVRLCLRRCLEPAWPGLGREDLSGRELVKKGIAAMLVAVGVALVTH